jgi:hypothetical protein
MRLDEGSPKESLRTSYRLMLSFALSFSSREGVGRAAKEANASATQVGKSGKGRSGRVVRSPLPAARGAI